MTPTKMNINELILVLQTLMEKHGNLPIRMDNWFGIGSPMGDFEQISVSYVELEEPEELQPNVKIKEYFIIEGIAN